MRKGHAPTQIDFVLSRLRLGQSRREIIDEFLKRWKVSTRSFDVRLRVAKDLLAQERAEVEKQRLESLKAEEQGKVRTSVEVALRLQSVCDKLYHEFQLASTTKERIDAAIAMVKVMSEFNRVMGYHAATRSEVAVQVEPRENSIGKYFEIVDARLKQEQK